MILFTFVFRYLTRRCILTGLFRMRKRMSSIARICKEKQRLQNKQILNIYFLTRIFSFLHLTSRNNIKFSLRYDKNHSEVIKKQNKI
jgi:hypothetical protein